MASVATTQFCHCSVEAATHSTEVNRVASALVELRCLEILSYGGNSCDLMSMYYMLAAVQGLSSCLLLTLPLWMILIPIFKMRNLRPRGVKLLV